MNIVFWVFVRLNDQLLRFVVRFPFHLDSIASTTWPTVGVAVPK